MDSVEVAVDAHRLGCATFGSARLAVPDSGRNAHLDVECNGLAVDGYTGCKGNSAVLRVSFVRP